VNLKLDFIDVDLIYSRKSNDGFHAKVDSVDFDV